MRTSRPSPRRARLLLAAAAGAALVAGVAWVGEGAMPQGSGRVDLLTQANLRLDGVQAEDEAGRAVAGAGDVNGDGLGDVIVGAHSANGAGRANSGEAYVVFGQPVPTDVDLAALGGHGFRIAGAAADDEAGSAVAGAGDVNGDGRADVMVGAPLADHGGRADAGAAFVVFGGPAPADVDLAALGPRGVRIDGGVAGDEAGNAVAAAGDVDGDGRRDLVVGAHGADNGMRTGSGSAYVILGRPALADIDLADPGPGVARFDGAANDEAGFAVAGAGDVNGDGRADVLVGAPNASNNGRIISGSAYLVLGRAVPTDVDLTTPGAAVRFDGAEGGDTVGFAVAGPGDVDGDGRADLLLGAHGANPNGRGDSGAAYLVLGRPAPTGLDLAVPTPRVSVVGGALEGEEAGTSVGGAGDVNGDGRPDLIVGAPFAGSDGRGAAGAGYVVFGSPAPANVDLAALGAAGIRIDGAAAFDHAGVAVAGAGDINGDGRADALVGAPTAGANGRPESGSAFGVLGFGRPALAYPALVGRIGTPLAPLAPAVRRTGPARFAAARDLPAGLVLDPATGVVAGTPRTAGATTVTVTMSDLVDTVSAPLSIRVGGATAASLRRCLGRSATIVGTVRRDRIRGTRRADVIVALGGADVVRGGGGADRICLGAGADRATGGAGADRILGEGGADRILGGAGPDRLLGGPGPDLLVGGAGRDRLAGGPGRDRLRTR